MLAGEYSNPIRVIAFNTNEGWSVDVSADVAYEIRRRCDLQLERSERVHGEHAVDLAPGKR